MSYNRVNLACNIFTDSIQLTDYRSLFELTYTRDFFNIGTVNFVLR